MKFIPGTDRDLARVIEEIRRDHEDRLKALERKGGRAGVVLDDTAAKIGEFLNIEGSSSETITIVLPESTQARRNARVTLAFRNENPVRIVAVNGTVNGLPFVLNDRPGTYDAICDGLGGWAVQVGVSEDGSGAGGGGGALDDIPDQTVLGNDSGVTGPPEAITVHQELDWLLAAGSWVFDGVDDVITVADVLPKERTDSFSMSYWIQTASTNGFAIGKFVTSPTTRGYAAQMVSGRMRFVLSSTNTTSVLAVETTSAFNDNVLRNVVMTYNGTSLASGVAIYVNGVAQATSIIFNNLTTTTLSASTFTLGPLGAVAGTIQHPAMWSDDLTAAEALEVYGGGTPPDLRSISCASDLEGWWKVDGSDVTGAGGVADHSVNSNVGTAGGGLGTGGSTVGSLPVRGSAVWELITPGTVDLPLVSNGAGLKPAYERLANAGLATMTAHTYKGNNTGSTASASDVAISGLAGAGMTATGSTLNVIGSTSITVNADDIQRPALTGFAAASANSNATTSAEPIVTYSASANMSAERVTTSSTSVTVDTSVASQIEFRRAALTGAIAATANSNATLFAGIRDNGSAENDRTNLNFLSTATASLTVTDDSGNDELEITVNVLGVPVSVVNPTHLAVFGTPTNAGVPFIVYVAYAAGGGGAADDVTVFSASAPFAFRILEAWQVTATAVALATVQARTATGGGGTALTTAMAATVTGKTSDNSTATTTVAASGSVFLRRSDNGVAGEFIALCVRT